MMHSWPIASKYVLFAVCSFPLIYYAIAIFSAGRFFSDRTVRPKAKNSYTPPVSNLKPVKGLDPNAYENFASFCQQDYPEYEILFCVDYDDEALPVLERLVRDFPDKNIRIIYGSGRVAINDKVARLARLVSEARYETVVISDSDVRVASDYLRTVVAPLEDASIGAVTCFYAHSDERTVAQHLQTVGMMSDFYAGILTARQLDGVKFALGPTIATTRKRLAGFGGYEAIENQPGDDLLVGRLIAEQGFRVELLAYSVEAVADYHSISDLVLKRLRWIVVMRHMRPWGHMGLIFTQGLFWSLVAVAAHPTLVVASVYLGLYALLRAAMAWMIGSWGLKQNGIWKQLPLIPLWDALAFCLWIASFTRNSVRWRGARYYIRNGELIPATPQPASAPAAD
ncbi:MAG TPA: glycosyltransferase [Candidatus Acidoferrales bacterium]